MTENFDLIVIGGGINGSAIARDAAMRGLKVVLIEKHDFAFAASGNNSQMIHGGARYLTSDIRTTKKSCIDSNYIQKIAPHLVFRIPFVSPVHKKAKMAGFGARVKLELMEAFFLAYDKYNQLKNGKKHIRLSPEEATQLVPGLTEDIVGAVTFDEYGVDSPRLNLANALSAQENSAIVLNHTEITNLLMKEGRVYGVETRDCLTGTRNSYEAKIIFNATGSWAPELAKKAGISLKLRPTKGIHVSFEGRFLNMGIVTETIDGRTVFLMPHQNTMVLGTSDDDYYGPLDDVPILEDEVEYLIQAIEDVYPDIRKARRIRSWVGVRPTLYEWGPYEDDLSREHEIIDHELRDGISGFMTAVGGKLASFRLLAEQATDKICQKLGLKTQCQTHATALPGGESLVGSVDIEKLSQEYSMDAYTLSRLSYRHGARVRKVLELCQENPEYSLTVCSCEPVIEAEIRYTVRHELCKTLDDLRRRTRFSLGTCQGTDCSWKAAQIMADELNWSFEETLRQVKLFFQEKWKQKSSILQGAQLQNEEKHASIYYGLGDM